MSRTRPRATRGFGARLLLTQALLLVAGAVTAYLVASLVGPGLFHQHLLEAGTDPSSSQTYHLEMAFRDALLVAMGVALLPEGPYEKPSTPRIEKLGPIPEDRFDLIRKNISVVRAAAGSTVTIAEEHR